MYSATESAGGGLPLGLRLGVVRKRKNLKFSLTLRFEGDLGRARNSGDPRQADAETFRED